MYWYLKVMRYNYANFSGRARRKEYWMFVLVQLAIIILTMSYISIVDDLFGTPIVGYLLAAYLMASLIPWLALNVRRMHDIGKSGGYIFINFIPIIGRIWYIVLVATEGDSGDNYYGPDPKKDDFDEIDDIGQLDE
ncbi:DUF805 domain-containing protein [uncultured Psychroserpens sp.]|uniref:DUF805 domain-containing protein n=1 Tax=uncultured Psychroserpens sp. TaxID=255436 RepID=UPI00262F50DA|nr:DUF805 domain-containing protein [uncultured Psychroserpens sp.]